MRWVPFSGSAGVPKRAFPVLAGPRRGPEGRQPFWASGWPPLSGSFWGFGALGSFCPDRRRVLAGRGFWRRAPTRFRVGGFEVGVSTMVSDRGLRPWFEPL